MEETTHDIRAADTLEAWQQALAEVPPTPALSGALLQRRDDLFGRFVAWYQRLRSRPRAERRRWQRQLGLSLAGIALLLAVNGAPAGAVGPAATITVTNGTGTIANGDGCSLPEAIINANADNQSGSTDCAAGSGADTISLGTNVTLTAVNDSTYGPTGLPVVISAITIEGNGYTISRDSYAPDFRILAVVNGGNLTLNSITISGGVASGDSLTGHGGGIHASAATVTVSNSTLSGNTATYEGGGIDARNATVTVSNSTLSGNSAQRAGGIYNIESTLSVQNSTLSGNSASFNGGGLENVYATVTVQKSILSGNSANFLGGGISNRFGTVTMQNSTLSGNSARFGGGLGNAYGTVTVQNSTLSGNSAGWGGGIYNFESTLSVQNSTLSDNSASDGGGIFNDDGTVTVENSIVVRQSAGADCTNNGTLTSNGYNIESATSCGFTGTGDQQGVSDVDLNLGALANNGGPTQTMALGSDSVAIDQIPKDVLEANGCGVMVTTDQRGALRAGGTGTTGGSACDVGAYEYASTPLAVTLANFAAQAMSDHILLTWETVSEINNSGFNLYRSASPAAPGELLAFVPSQAPGSTQGASYSFDDTEVSAGQTWYYWLEDVDLNGATALHGPVSATLQAPTAVTLGALEAQAANPGATPWGVLVAGLLAAAGALATRRRWRAR